MTQRRLLFLGFEVVIGLLLISSVLVGAMLLVGGAEPTHLEQYAADTATLLADPAVYGDPKRQAHVVETLPEDVGYYVVVPEQTVGSPPPPAQKTVTVRRAHPEGSIEVTVWRQ